MCGPLSAICDCMLQWKECVGLSRLLSVCENECFEDPAVNHVQMINGESEFCVLFVFVFAFACQRLIVTRRIRDACRSTN